VVSPGRRLLRAGELAVVILVALLLPAAAVGWLYLLRGSGGSLPGPHVRDALPLDELPGHASVNAGLFVAVWLAAALVVGLLARAARVERLLSALLFALVSGAIVFAATGASIFVVRQIPAGEAFKAAGRVEAVYLSAGLAGLGAALLGSRRIGGRRWPAVLALLVAASGVLDVASAITPAIESRLHLIENATPNFVPKVASALVVPAGLMLVVLARGLWRRRRRAWQLTLAAVSAAAVLHLLKGLDYEEAAANALLALALIARRHDFAGRGDPTVRVRLAARAALYAAGIVLYGFAALWINRAAADRPFTFGFALKEIGESLVGAELVGARHVTGEFGRWFPLSVLLLGVTAATSLLWSWLAPWRYRLSQEARERARAQALVERFGIDTLAPFALRADKSYFFSEDERAFLAYKVVAGVAVVSGDPIGPPDAVEPLIARFLGFAHERDWRVAMLGAGERYLDLYRAAGLRALYHGEEAVVRVESFALEGRAIRKVRQSVARLERQGYRAEVLYAREVHDELRAELQDVFDEWRRGAATKGFTMELDTLFRLEGDEALFVIGRARDGTPQGFLHFVVAGPASALSLSSMPRRSTTPNGFNEWLVVTTIEWAKAHGYDQISMNFAPFAALLAADAEVTRKTERLQRRALRALKGHGFQLENLLAFNRKFFPDWQRRYVIYERTTDLPRVGIAGLAAEGYLPLTGSRK
jgi:lysyl-tRNA synthetase, class II